MTLPAQATAVTAVYEALRAVEWRPLSDNRRSPHFAPNVLRAAAPVDLAGFSVPKIQNALVALISEGLVRRCTVVVHGRRYPSYVRRDAHAALNTDRP